MSVGALTSNVVFHGRAKHVEKDMHIIRKQMVDKKLKVQHVPTKHQVADILTKSQPTTRFELIRIG